MPIAAAAHRRQSSNARSHTRRLAHEFVSAWRCERLDDRVDHLDPGRTPPPHVDESWIAAAFTAPTHRIDAMRATLRVSDALIAQLMDADMIVVGVSMYNLSVPSSFKASIDQIVSIGVTFAFEPEDDKQLYKPLVRGKRMIKRATSM
jgi:FMN-dependent NADH-azoreductase